MTKGSEERMLQKGVYTGIIEKDENNNFFCGIYLLDYKMFKQNMLWVIGLLSNQSLKILATSVIINTQRSLKTLTKQIISQNNKSLL